VEIFKRITQWTPGRRRAAFAAVIAACLTGCLGEPEIDKRWTLLEFLAQTPGPTDVLPGGQTANVSVKGRITYRRILTGFVVAEVRYSPSLASVPLDPTEHTEQAAESVDLILANSVTAGRATRIVTGFDHLMQEVDLTFTAQVPDSLYGGGLYLLLYMGEGEEIELPGGGDSLVVTPFVSGDQEILHTGFPLAITP
jgi:hypothetical protein